ncbi:MAG: hypothetical protein H6Q02_2583 [Acidobacteria bacterium]|nr:hypothetical protein [Acidobacteriota bacterium]
MRDADLIGLFARENIIIGRFTGGSNWGLVDGWLANADNQSKEDLGIDNLPNTGDLNENNNVWNVRTYAADGQGQCGSGLLPAGYAIGDVIPGSGEDIDGDARFDDRIRRGTLNIQGLPTAGSSSFALPQNLNDRLNSSAADPNTAAPLDTDGDGRIWRGSPLWVDALTTHSWNEVAPDPPRVPQIAGVLYTNHAIAGVFLPDASGIIETYGSFVSRIEATVGASITMFTHDPRLLGGAKDFGIYLPREKAIEIRAWKEEVADQ